MLIKCTEKIGYEDLELEKIVDWNDVIEVDEARAKYLVEERQLCRYLTDEELKEIQEQGVNGKEEAGEEDKADQSKDEIKDDEPEVKNKPTKPKR